MFTLLQVIEGLKLGFAYFRKLDDDDGKEYVSSTAHDEFRHDVAGESNGGWGGSSELLIEILSNGRWPSDGWEQLST